MKTKISHLITALCTLVLVGSVSATPVPTVYSDMTAFQTALGGNPVYTLPLQTPSGTQQDVHPGITIGDATYAASGLFLFNDGFYGASNFYLGGVFSDLSVTLAGSHQAVDFDVGLFNGAGPITLSINGGSASSYSIGGAPASTFFGITNASPITSLVFHDANNNGTEIDIVSPQAGTIDLSGGGGSVPEPSTYAAICGVLVLGLATWRRRRQLA